jgi:hypothetical protein
VSVTQPLNTTVSLGRLTLNILLSFAQFERELVDLVSRTFYIHPVHQHAIDASCLNSLEAQREAAEAYILSYTGGNIERPALKQLLAIIVMVAAQWRVRSPAHNGMGSPSLPWTAIGSEDDQQCIAQPLRCRHLHAQVNGRRFESAVQPG